MKITVRNYRPFGASHPLELEIKDGITALVGKNNSGKSFVLRFFHEMKPLFTWLLNNQFNTGQTQYGVSFNVSHPLEVFHKHNNMGINMAIEASQVKLSVEIQRGNAPLISKIDLVVDGTKVENGSLVRKDNDGHKLLDRNSTVIKKMRPDALKFLETLLSMTYFPAFRNTVNVGANADYYGMKIGSAFIQAWHNLSTNADPTMRNYCNQISEDLRELFNYKKFEVRSAMETNTMIIQINDDSYPLTDLGAGITQFILVFVNAAIQRPNYLLIDEPELNLHPKLQIDFINRLLKYTKNGILLATHSLGLAHSVAERIYSVTMTPKSESIIKPFESTPSFPEFLGELNFSGFPALGFKKVLLVEGPTDVIVFSEFLHKLGKYGDFLIWPLGGDSLINGNTAQQLDQIKRLGTGIQIFCWIDSEKSSKESDIPLQRKEFEQNCKTLGIDVKISCYRRIENYFPLEVIQKINAKVDRSLENYEKPPDGWDWSKGSNWRIAQELDIERHLKGTDLYDFLHKI